MTSEQLAAVFRDAVEGRREALDHLVRQLTPLLWRVARSTGLDTAACEDVVQQTWLRLIGHLDRIHTPQALTGWLVTVTRREAVRVQIAQQRTGHAADHTLDQLPDGRAPVEDTVADTERGRVLWRVIARLPKRCVQLLQVIAFSERPDYAGIAAALGMPTGSIGPTRGRCLGKLRQLLAADPEWSW